jgi:hypothetical protein
MRFLRFRHLFMIGGTVVVMLYLWLTDPNDGALTLTFFAKLATPVIAVWFAHLARKALFDYIDLSQLYYKAKQSTVGAGLVFLGICIVVFGLLGLFGSQVYAQDVKTYIPVQATLHLPTLRIQQESLWPANPKGTPLLV